MVVNSPNERPRREVVYGCVAAGVFALGIGLVVLALGWLR